MKRLLTVVLTSVAFVGPANATCEGEYDDLLPFVPAAGWPNGWQGFVRVDNSLASAVTLSFTVVDDAGTTFEQSIAVGDGETLHFNSEDLQWGNADKGIAGVGAAPMGSWRLCFTDRPPDTAVSAYIRTQDGFLTDMTMTVEPAFQCKTQCPEWRVPIFNPATNINQLSFLRLINNSNAPAPIMIQGVKSDGAWNQDEDGVGLAVAGFLAARSAVEITSEQLESGQGIELARCSPSDAGECVEEIGRIGPATGKWALYISRPDGAPSHELVVMNLMRTPTGHVTTLAASADDTWIRR